MQQIRPSRATGANRVQWPRHRVNSIEARDIDLVVRITDWMKDKDEPGYDVEVYIGGVYDWNESKSFTIYELKEPALAKLSAIRFAQAQIEKLL